MPSERVRQFLCVLGSRHGFKSWWRRIGSNTRRELIQKLEAVAAAPPNATTVAPQTCAECGHSNVSEDGTCAELLLGPVPLAGMVYCGCACDFPARAEQVDAVAAERERCAQIAANWWTTKSTVGSPEAEAFQVASFEIANTIRRKLTK